MMRLKWLFSAGSLAVLLMTGGCQKRDKEVVVAQPPTGGPQIHQVQPPQPPPPPPEPANPQPQGENWVYTPRLTNYIGQALEVRYKLPAVDPDAWIAMVPEWFADTDAPSNQAATRLPVELVPAAEAAVNVPLTETGQFRLRLFDGTAADSKLLGETPPVTITQWPLGDRANSQPPYVTIGPPTSADSPVRVEQGLPVIGYYEVPAGYPPTAWIGVIPARVVSPVSSDNDGSDVKFEKLLGTKGQSTWMSDQQGTFVFRIFPTDAAGADYVAESEPFMIVPKK
jgi:hypothetical protein